jgi:AbrB family looped-hinge helix DNA binding protein
MIFASHVPLWWYSGGVKTTVDNAGRVVLPAQVRRRAGLTAGAELDVRVDDEGSVRLVRTVPGPRLVRRGGRLVARPRVAVKKRLDVNVSALIEEERSRWPW